MNFFDQQEINILAQYSGKLKTDELQPIYDVLKETYRKVEFWANSVKNSLYPKGIVKLTKKPTNQANVFEFYQWAKIYPTIEDLQNKKLAYTVSIEKNGKIVVKIDTIGLFENDPLRKKYYTYRSNNQIVKEYDLVDFMDWNQLIKETISDIKGFEKKFEEVKKIIITSDLQNENQLPKKMTHHLNQILYGPPGTGKTYNTIDKAISIVNPEFDLSQDRAIVKQEYNRLVEAGQIAFTTFHQSMTYEDFIEGIKPLKPSDEDLNVKYDIQNGIFKTICINATQTEVSKDNFENTYQKLLEEIDKSPSKSLVLETLIHSKEFTIYKNSKGNLKFHANTEKAYEGVIRKEIIEHYLKTNEALDWPSYTKAVSQYLTEKFNYHKVLKPTEKKNYVLVVDEINRGNVSQIFGELITLIEEDKRVGNDEALEVILPYSKAKFGVPSNLHIIGTMNTADRSVEALDTALRRRFVFEEMPPKYDLDGLQQELYGYKAADILQKINLRIEKLLDCDHQIGHAYFLNKDKNTIVTSFYKNIIPLLKEYFFGDYGKIGLVLGEGFIKLKENDSVFAKFDYADASQFEERETYQILDHKDNTQDFGNAIELLMS